jgi:hypothetical protein
MQNAYKSDAKPKEAKEIENLYKIHAKAMQNAYKSNAKCVQKQCKT